MRLYNSLIMKSLSVNKQYWSLQQVFCYEVFVLDNTFLYLE